VAGLGRAGLAAVDALLALPGSPVVRAWDASRGSRTRRLRRDLALRGVPVLLGSDLAALDGAPPPRTLVKSPGIPADAPIVAAARARGMEVVGELELGWRLTRTPLLGVTGTNGKSTVCGLATAVLTADGAHAELAGNTTFGAPLSAVEPEGDWIVCEVSSFQLESAPALLPDLAAFTNLTQDHLRRHGTMERYGACKRRLFVRGEQAVPLAAIDVGGAFGRRLADDVAARGGRVLRVGGAHDAADYRVLDVRWDLRRGTLRCASPAGEVVLATRLPGVYNARNVALCVALADALGVSRSVSLPAIAAHPGTPGRFEHVDAGQPYTAVVDSAATPAAVAAFLSAARGAMGPRGRLRVVLGVLGAPGAAHSRATGAAAGRLADAVVVTVGSYRPGVREEGLDDLHAGACAGGPAAVRRIPRRHDAVAAALGAAGPHDVVALLGRGAVAETIGGGLDGAPRRTLDDGLVARELIAAAGAGTAGAIRETG